MKKFFAVILSMLLTAATCAGCAPKEQKKYGEEEMRTPFWTQDTMYNESVLLTRGKDERLAQGNLAFEPKGRVKITDPLMQIVYEEGKDFTMEGRTIRATENTSMPWLEEKVLFGIDMPEGKGLSTQPVSEAGAAKGYESVLYTESAFLIENQVLVTYDYDRREFDSKVIPAYQGEKLPNTLQKLQNKETVDIIAFGDSISTGCNSTGGGLQSVYDDTYPGNSVYLPFDRCAVHAYVPRNVCERSGCTLRCGNYDIRRGDGRADERLGSEKCRAPCRQSRYGIRSRPRHHNVRHERRYFERALGYV